MILLPQVIEITEYRAQLCDYIKNRIVAIAPNLTVLVGELVGARLISPDLYNFTSAGYRDNRI